MSSNNEKKVITFINWKQHKVEVALKQVEEIANDIISDLIFEIIMDFYRSKSYPGALPISELIQTFPINPNLPYEKLHLDVSEVQKAICPLCKKSFPHGFTDHLKECISRCEDPTKVLLEQIET